MAQASIPWDRMNVAAWSDVMSSPPLVHPKCRDRLGRCQEKSTTENEKDRIPHTGAGESTVNYTRIMWIHSTPAMCGIGQLYMGLMWIGGHGHMHGCAYDSYDVGAWLGCTMSM